MNLAKYLRENNGSIMINANSIPGGPSWGDMTINCHGLSFCYPFSFDNKNDLNKVTSQFKSDLLQKMEEIIEGINRKKED